MVTKVYSGLEEPTVADFQTQVIVTLEVVTEEDFESGTVVPEVLG